MQDDLDANFPDLDIQILGINSFGQETGVASFYGDRGQPVLQDIDANSDGSSDLWVSWNVEPRDVVILDAANKQVGVYNLTVHDLENASSYAALRQMLVTAAASSSLPAWRNPGNRFDVNNDGSVSPVGDVLVGINELNNHLLSDPVTGQLPDPPVAPNAPPPFLDVNGDGYVTAAGDILPVINYINNAATGEGEAATPMRARSAADGASVELDLPSRSCAAPADTATDPATAGRATSPTTVDLPPATAAGSARAPLRDPPTPSESSAVTELESLLATLAADLATVWHG